MKKLAMNIGMWSIFILFFNVLFFILKGFDNPASVWISYGFINGSYLILALTSFLNKGNNGLTALSATNYLINAKYFIAEFVVGLIFICLSLEGYVLALVVQMIMLAIYLILIFGNQMANTATQETMAKQNKDSVYFFMIAQKIKSRMYNIEDKVLRNKVIECYDAISYSPKESCPESEDAERKLECTVEDLAIAIDEANNEQIDTLCKRTVSLLKDRNAVVQRFRKM